MELTSDELIRIQRALGRIEGAVTAAEPEWVYELLTAAVAEIDSVLKTKISSVE